MTTAQYDKLTVISLDQEQHSRTCGYWYLVQNQHSAHTAFRTIEGLQKWAKERGLNLPELPAERGVYSFHFMPGSYSDHMHGNEEEFQALSGIECIKLSNGQ